MLADRRDKQVAVLRFRLGSVLVLRECARFFIAWTMIWAAAAVGLRAIFRVDPLLLLWGLVGLGAAAAAGTILAIRRLPSSAAIRATLDRHGCLGGLLMAAGETDIGPWRRHIPPARLPAIRWRAGRHGMLLLTSTAFLIAALLAPDRCLPAGNATLQVGGEIQKLSDKLQVLRQEQIVPPERAKVLEKELDGVRNEALGKDPAKTMEMLDHLEQSFSKAANDAAEAAIKQTETAARAEELADALHAAQAQMDPRQFGDAMKQLAHLADEAAAEDAALADGLSDELRKALRQAALTDEQLQELSKALKGCKACQRAKLLKLVKARLVDVDKLIYCDKAGECDEAALVDALSHCQGDKDLAEALAVCDAGKGGPGGGGPPAVMTWSNAADKQGAAFKEKLLPPGGAASLRQSRLAGVSASDPTAAKPAGGSAGGALGSAQAGGGEARTQTILPKYEKTVERYFHRESK
jgi:hypothetical protein